MCWQLAKRQERYQSVSTILGSLQRSAVDSSAASSNSHFTSYSQPFAPFSATSPFLPPGIAFAILPTILPEAPVNEICRLFRVTVRLFSTRIAEGTFLAAPGFA